MAAIWKQPVADLDFEKSENWKIRGHVRRLIVNNLGASPSGFSENPMCELHWKRGSAFLAKR
jgi:hypothetical protein